MNNLIWSLCSLINLCIATLHIYIVYKGASALRYFGAGEWMATQHEKGSIIPASITLSVTAVFILFALYNLAGTSWVNLPLPQVFWVLAAITIIFLFRGVLVVFAPFLSQPLTQFDIVSSFISLFIGFLHLAGMYFLYHNEGITS